MPNTDATAPPEISGRLSETPLHALLRTVQRRQLTGTLSVARPDQNRLLFFEAGELRAARSSCEEHRVGHRLVLWGYLSAEQLAATLRLQTERGGRLGQILVSQGLVSRSVLDDEVRRLMEEIVLSALSWSDGLYHFVPGSTAAEDDIAVSLSTTELIIEAIRRIPESEQFVERLGDLSVVPVLSETVAEAAASVRLPSDAAFLLSRIDGRTSLRDLLKLAPGPAATGAKLLYTLVYCGLAEMTTAPRRAEPPDPSPSPRDDHRDLVENTYRRMDWLSHYDLLGVSCRATSEEIEQAFRARSRLFDPSLASGGALAVCRQQLTVLAARLRAAYGVLSRPKSREAYDSSIERAEVLPSAPPSEADRDAEQKMVRARRETASHNFRKAAELVSRKEFFPAIQLLQEAVRFAPTNADYHRLLAAALSKNPWWQEEAIEHLEEAARLEPRTADVHGRLAEAYLEQGAPEKALSSARTALNVAPDKEKAPYRLLEHKIEQVLGAARELRRARPLALLRATA